MRMTIAAGLIAGLTCAAFDASADHLVLRAGGTATTSSLAEIGAIQSETMTLPVSGAADGGVAVSLNQADIDAAFPRSVGPEDAKTPIRIRLLAPSSGPVTDNGGGAVSVRLSTAIAIDNIPSGTSAIYDVTIHGAADGNAPYGAEIPIEIEGWRRQDDGTPVAKPTKGNRAFWGVLSGHFEP